jgi:uracil-DNA glycosylase
MSLERRQAVFRKLQGLQRAGVQYLVDSKLCGSLISAGEVTPRSNASSHGIVQGDSKIPQVPVPLQEEPTISSRVAMKEFHGAEFVGDALEALTVIDQEVRGCTACEVLVKNRTQTVFGSGNPQARLVFMGEAPGADEDRQGVPFVGRAGQLLDKILEACGLRRDEVYILNALKCRPPNNRTPEPREVDSCRDFFEGQLAIIKPEFICCLGLVAASALLQQKVPLGALRGRLHPWRSSRVLVTYHPAYLLRNPAAKKWTWEDMQLLMREMGLQIPNQTNE